MGSVPLISGPLLTLNKSDFKLFDDYPEMTKVEWLRKLDDMQGVGFDLLFIFSIEVEDLIRKTVSERDPLEFIFSECDRRGIEVIITASCWGDWQKGGLDISKEMRNVKVTTNEFHVRYGAHVSFAGWYLPYECNMFPPGLCADFLAGLYRAATERCKSLTPHLPVAVSPFFVPDTTGKCMTFEYREPSEYVDFWSKTLASAKIDVLALQDNGGQHLSCFTEKDTMPFIEAFVKACTNTGTKFWGNVETGEFPVADVDDFVHRFGAKEDVNNLKFRDNWRAVPIDTLIRKLELISPFSVRNVSWGYFEFLDPSKGLLSRRAYEEYRAYKQRLNKNSE